MTKSVNQLINFFRPAGYQLSIDARPGRRDFSGQLFIAGNQIEGKKIRLHAKGLKLSNVQVNYSPVKIVELDNDEIELLPQENRDLKPDHAADLLKRWGEKCDTSIALDFSGQMQDSAMHGLYPCYYEIDGEKKELLATQFESHYAREVFPCVDEPAAKAKFLLQVNTAPEFQVLSNMPVETEVLDGESDNLIVKFAHKPDEEKKPPRDLTKFNDRRVSFQMTPKMSTYLLAWVIGDLHKKTARTKRGVEVNVYATPAQPADSLDFALDVAVKSIDFFEEYFGVDYPLPKSDHVALPDFSSGAMENWGLITYRETALLAGKDAAIANKQYIATVIAHELSHQWFGNLTTMQWWNDLWLNESFAELMMHLSIDQIFPEYEIWNDFDSSVVTSALRRDALPGVQAVRQDVHHPDEISTLFDPAIVYAKGARLLKMLMNFIGEDTFRKGLRDYFQKFAYQNTAADNLWDCLSEAAKACHPEPVEGSLHGEDSSADARNDNCSLDVAALMTPWLTRPGYPLVTVRFDEPTSGDVTLTQYRFSLDSTSRDQQIDDSDREVWPIPLFCNNPQAPKIFDTQKITFHTDKIDNFELNVGNNAHFVAAYAIDYDSREHFYAKVKTRPVADRLKFLNEFLLLAPAGWQRTCELLNILPHFADEENDAVWEAISAAIGTLAKFVEPDSDDEKNLKKLAGKLARKQYARLGWKPRDGESLGDQKLRSTVIYQMIFAEDRAAIDQALEIYSANKHDLTAIDGDLRAIILGAALRFGGEDEFSYLLDIYKTSQKADLKQEIGLALASTREENQIKEILNFIDKSNIVKPQDVRTWFFYMLRNRRSRAAAWDWMMAHWAWIEQTFAGDMSYDSFPYYSGAILQTEAELTEFDKFFAPLKNKPALTRAIQVGHNDIAARAEWIGRDRETLLQKLSVINSVAATS